MKGNLRIERIEPLNKRWMLEVKNSKEELQTNSEWT